jgi:hypothetical protein
MSFAIGLTTVVVYADSARGVDSSLTIAVVRVKARLSEALAKASKLLRTLTSEANGCASASDMS